MTLATVVVLLLLAAIAVPIVRAEVARAGNRRRPATPARPIKREPTQKTPLRLVVNRHDMDRELAALLAKDSRQPPEREDTSGAG